jgi:hypothetical protein
MQGQHNAGCAVLRPGDSACLRGPSVRTQKARRTGGPEASIAGTDRFDNGDFGPATQAFLTSRVALAPFGFLPYNIYRRNPPSLAVDRDRNIFLVDGDSVRKVAPDGMITTVAGTEASGFQGDGGIAGNGDCGPAVEAAIGGPEGLAVDASGNLYVADRFFYRVRKVSPDERISTVAGTARRGRSGHGSAATNAQLLIPYSLAVAEDGSLTSAMSRPPISGR